MLLSEQERAFLRQVTPQVTPPSGIYADLQRDLQRGLQAPAKPLGDDDYLDPDDVPDSASAMSTEVPDEVKAQLKDTLSSLLVVQRLITEYTMHLKQLKLMQARLKAESMGIMQGYRVNDVTVEKEYKYEVREYQKKDNPFVRKKLPQNLAKYFQETERIDSDAALRRAEAILQWVEEHATTYTPGVCMKRTKVPKTKIKPTPTG